MKVKFYLLPLLLLLFIQTKAQDCSTLSLSYSTSESRCVSTGSITVDVTGGSGNYNYKATGPVITHTTSSNILTGLPSGYYTIQVKDLITGCIKEVDSAFVPGAYSDPRFQLIKTDVSCALNDGTISVANQQFGRSPFTYTIISPSPSHVGQTNTNGSFIGLLAGEYSIQLQDSCSGVQVRKITIENYNWWFDFYSITRFGCDSATEVINVRDNKGNVNTSGSAFNGFTYGVVVTPGDTIWKSNNLFNFFLGKKRSATIVVKDACGTIKSAVWTLPDNLKPSLGNVNLSNLACSGFTAGITSQNVSSPQYCLYDNNNVWLSCNSSGIFNNLAYGSYCIKLTDPCYDTTITRCFTATAPVPSVAATVTISNRTCSSFTATITGQTNLTNPNYCIYDASNNLISCNTTGVFNNLVYGSYCIKTTDGCTATVITRCFTTAKALPVLTGYTITGSTCNGFNVTASGDNVDHSLFCLYDSLGNVVDCDSTGVFMGLSHGHYCIRAVSCGDTTNTLCFTSPRPVPSVNPTVLITNLSCTGFTASLTGQTNLTNPQYCLYTSSDSLIGCNTSGSFDLDYGSYCIKLHNTCYDTIITRCFAQYRAVPSLSATIQLLSTTCATVSFKATGTNLTNPLYELLNASDSVLASNNTGVFNNEPYGQYCVRVHDSCVDTTMRVCQNFAPPRGISLSTSKSCSINMANVDVQFVSGSAPYTINVYHPNGSLVFNTITSNNPYRILLASLPAGSQYKIVGMDNCGYTDSATIAPDANIVTKTVSVRAKCPSALWLNGAGDLQVNASSNFYSVIPNIIKKNGLVFNQGYSSVTGTSYTFADLEPAQYIVQYTQQNCNGRLYDTVTVPPYAYPSQGQSAIYQCDNNSFSLGADVAGGVSPYSFQIIGSTPQLPTIATTPQSNPVFDINNGTVYSLVRLRTIDACGNATLSDVSVLPLQNISVVPSNTCFYQNIVLSVDTVPNASYTWYWKTSPTDSVLVGSGLTYNFPFFVPEQTGEYVCKMTVNNGCITRLSSFNMDGQCGQLVLPLSFRLNGKQTTKGNELYWNNGQESGIQQYVVERKTSSDASYKQIGIVKPASGGRYVYDDGDAITGPSMYRLKLVYAAKIEYSNIVRLGEVKSTMLIYPNPAKDVLNISLTKQSHYKIEILSTGGQLVYSTEIKNNSATIFQYTRDKKSPTGMYLVRVTDLIAGTTEIRKLLFE
ncbi:MAG: T9SS type A sorting domain-containing protein [Flavisolibacter sp.]